MRLRRRIAADLADDELLAARHRQRLGHAAQHHFPMSIAVGAHAALEAAYGLACDQAIAVNADEARTEFLFQPGKRFLEEKFAVGRAYGDVLELGLEINDFVDRYEHDPRSLGHRQKPARRGG